MTGANQLTLHEIYWQHKDQTNFYTVEWRPAEPRAAVLLVHGLGEHCRRYDHVARQFGAQGFAMLGFDMRGHGRTSGKRGHIPSFDHSMDDIDHFLSLLREHFPGLPCFLYGHSMGGMHALHFVLSRQPTITGCISTSPGLVPGAPIPAWKTALGKLLYYLAPQFTMDNGLDLRYISRDPAAVQAYKNDPLVSNLISMRLGLDLIESGRWVVEHAEDFDLPLLLMLGTADTLVSLEHIRSFAAHVPRQLITLKEWEGLYHELHNETEKEQVIAAMLDWMKAQIN